MPGTKGTVVVVSSQVARGSVGNRAMVFALERLGFRVWAVPTVLMPHHPGHGPVERIIPEAKQFSSLLQALIGRGHAGEVAAVVSGYFASPEQADAVATLVQAVKAARPDTLYLCDPILGDLGRLYIAEDTATAIRDRLLPLADIAKPNAFECAWLTASSPSPLSASDLATSARQLPPPRMLVTSAPALMSGHIGNLLVDGQETLLFEHRAVVTAAKGTGDLLGALMLGRRLEGHDWPKAIEMAVASVFEIVVATSKAGADELLLAEHQQAIAQPHTPVSVRRLGGKRG